MASDTHVTLLIQLKVHNRSFGKLGNRQVYIHLHTQQRIKSAMEWKQHPSSVVSKWVTQTSRTGQAEREDPGYQGAQAWKIQHRRRKHFGNDIPQERKMVSLHHLNSLTGTPLHVLYPDCENQGSHTRRGSQERTEVYPWYLEVFEKLSPTFSNSWKTQFELVKNLNYRLKKKKKILYLKNLSILCPGI